MKKYLEDSAEKAEKEFFDALDKMALRAFEKTVKPYLDKYSLSFIAGNGTYYIGWTENTPESFIQKYKACSWMQPDSVLGFIDGDKLPKTVQDVLNYYPRMYDYPLGSLMPSYNQEKGVRRG